MNEIPNLYEALAQVVRAARKERKIPQRELAARMGCARSFIAAIEGCKFQLSLNAFLCMAKALGMEPEELIRLVKSALLLLDNGCVPGKGDWICTEKGERYSGGDGRPVAG